MIRARVWKFGDNIDTDRIAPGPYLHLTTPEELGPHALEGVDPEFPKKFKKGEIIVGQLNFGCGSSREQAPSALKGIAPGAIIAASYGRIFLRNGVNIGLPLLTCAEAAHEIKDGDDIEVDLATGKITDHTTGKTYQAQPFPEAIQQIIAAGGMINYVRQRVGKP